MKYWKCMVCGYIHPGDESLETCPVCKATKDKFEEMPEEEGKEAKQAYEKRMAKRKAKQAQPEAGTASGSQTTAPGTQAMGALDRIIALMTKEKAHPITVHMPNGLLPVVVLFLLLSFIFDSMGFAQVSFYNLVVVVLTMPMVLFSGYADWQSKYGGQMTPVFRQKIAMGIIVILLCAVLVVWCLIDDTVMTAGNSSRLAFLGVHILALIAATYAGHLGGKLVFGD